MTKITYTEELIGQIGDELMRRYRMCNRDGAALSRNEIACMLSGVYAVFCSTATNIADTYKWLEPYENELLGEG